MRKLFKNGRYANVTASLALFVALGGTSYAALTLPANSVSTKQIKKGAVTLNRLSSGAKSSLRGHTGARGPAGPQGPAGPAGASGNGAAGVPIWAAVTLAGNLGRNSHATDAGSIGSGVYRVTFDRDVSNCVYSATLGGNTGTDDQNVDGHISAVRRISSTTGGTQVEVRTAPAAPFYLVVSC